MKSLYYIIAVVLMLLSSSTGYALESDRANYLPPDGIVRNKQVAIAIAEVVLIDVYGVNTIKRQKPLHAELINKHFWLVSGTFPNNTNEKGGVAYIKIRKKDGAILGMIHQK